MRRQLIALRIIEPQAKAVDNNSNENNNEKARAVHADSNENN